MFPKKIYSVVALAALLVCGFLATSLISYFVAHDSLSHRISEETLPLTSDNVYSEIQRDLLRSVLISSLMAHDTFVRDWTLAGEKDTKKIIRYLAEIRKKYDTITAFFVSDSTLRYYHPDGILKTVSPDDPGDAWYFRVRRMNEPYEINVDSDTADRSRLDIFVNYRVTDFNDHYIGAIGVGLSVDAVRDMIESYQKRYGRRIYFIDREGRVKLHGSQFDGMNDIHDRSGLAQFATRILTNPSSSFSYVGANGDKTYVNARLVPQFNWYLVVEQQAWPDEARILKTLALNIIISLVITVLVLLLAHLLIRGYQRRLEAMATTDKLTGAANRHVFEVLFEQTVKTSKRRGEPVCVVSLDIDHFKAVNDNFGHAGGDAVIQALADNVRAEMRESDTLCRWGGEEFLVLMPNCQVENAAHRAEAIRNAVRNKPIRFGRDDIRITISLGVAQYRETESLDSLVARVDSALYRSKRDGRDRVSVDPGRAAWIRRCTVQNAKDGTESALRLRAKHRHPTRPHNLTAQRNLSSTGTTGNSAGHLREFGGS